MARDPSRIPVVLEALRIAWEANPDWRLGQLIVNVSDRRDPFHIEDDDMHRRLTPGESRAEASPPVVAGIPRCPHGAPTWACNDA